MIDISSKSFIQTIENSTNINSYITIYVTSNTGVAFSFLNNLEGTGI